VRPLLVAGALLLSYIAGCESRASLGLTQGVPELIDQAAAEYGIPGAAPALRRIAWCESRWFPGAYNRSSGASGVFQFVAATWLYASRMAGFAGASPFEAVANVYSGVWLYRAEGPRHWVCR
jgi:hypothetical protein